MFKKAIKKTLAIAILILSPTWAIATVLTPNPNSSNESHWDSILGSGSFDAYSNTMRGIPTVLLLLVAAWAVFGLFRAAFIEGSITAVDFAIYAGRLLLIITISITLIVT